MLLFIISMIIVFLIPILWYVFAKLKQNKQLKTNVKPIKRELEKEVRMNMKEISLGEFGTFNKEKINIDYVLDELSEIVNNNNYVLLVLKKINEIKEIIENNSQYIINYFMSKIIINYGSFDEMWDNYYLSEEQKGLSESVLKEFREKHYNNFLKEVILYLNRENILDIRNLYKKYLPFFEYDNFVKTICLEYLTLSSDTFSIQLSDESEEFLCAAMETFDKNLKAYDWHNF